MLVAFAALVVASPVGLQIAEARDLSPAERTELLQASADALETVCARIVRTDDLSASDCAVRADCATNARNRLRVDTLVELEVVRGVTLVRVQARRAGVAPTQVDLPAGEPGAWPRALEGLFRGLFLEEFAPAGPSTRLTARSAAPEASARVAPWIALGAAAAALGVGVGLGVSSRGARSAAETAPDLGTYEDKADSAQRLGWGANAMFGVAGAAALAGGLLWWLAE